MEIVVSHKEVYGRPLYYPENNTAFVVCSLLGTKSMSMHHVSICKNAGWKVTIQEHQKKIIL